MAKIMNLQGRVLRATVRRKNDGSGAYGTNLNILTEPGGDPCDVLVFSRLMDPHDAEQLEGEYVNLLVAVSVTAGSRGGAFLNVNAEQLEVIETSDNESAAVA